MKTLADVYGFCAPTPLDKYKYNAIFLPWIHSKPVVNHADSAFLRSTKYETEQQVEKIRSLLSSFKEHGYDTKRASNQRGGNIIGYWLKRATKKRFYVVSGNHRVATWFALNPESSLPITKFKKKHMKGRDLQNNEPAKQEEFALWFAVENVDNWASVKSGFLEKNMAIDIFDAYFGE